MCDPIGVIRPALLLSVLTLFGAACTRTEIDDDLGRFHITVGSDLALKISHADGLELEADGDRLIAFRSASATYEMQYGSFRIEESPKSEWVHGAKLTDVFAHAGAITATVLDADDTPIGDLFISPELDNLMISFTAIGEDNRSAVTLDCDDAGGFLGFGAQTHDVDHRGQIVPVWVSEQGVGKVDDDTLPEAWFLLGTRHQSYLSVPTMLAPRGGASWGLHADTDYRSVWDLCSTDPGALRVEVWDGRAQLWISPGPTPLEVIAQQTSRVGRVPPGPDWTYGVWMEKTGGSAAVYQEVADLRAANVPVSAIWSEDWRGGNHEGNSYVLEEDWRWDRALYPELPQLIDDLHAAGVKFQVYFNTFISRSADVWSEAHDGGHFVLDRDAEPYLFDSAKWEPAGLAELFSSETRSWVKAFLREALDLGVDGWMADFAEWYPADRRTVATGDGSDPEAAHNRYPFEWAKVNREVIEESGRDDVVVYHRSGYTGSQAVTSVIWAGDQRTSFQDDDGLPTVVPIMLGLGVVGFPIVTHDIGGYASATNEPTSKDLFFRWASLGALGPVMRTHHGRDAALNWRWDRDAETTAHFVRWAQLHTRLFPTWKALGNDAAATGAPVVRPLAFAEPGNLALHGVRDAFTIGDRLLVAPVLTASTASRMVPLPTGRWFDWFTGATHEGPGQIEVAVPLGALPIFARAGAIVPMLPQGVESLVAAENTNDIDDVRHQREVRVWLGADGEASAAEGGSYVLTSPSAPTGELDVSGGQVVVHTSSSNHLVFDAPPNGTVTIGGQHKLTTEGLVARTTLRFDVRW